MNNGLRNSAQHVAFTSDRFLGNVVSVNQWGEIETDGARSGLAAVGGDAAFAMADELGNRGDGSAFWWFCNPHNELERRLAGRELTYRGMKVVFNPIDEATHSKGRSFISTMIWFANHRLDVYLSKFEYMREEFDALREINRRKAETMRKFLPDDAIVLAQDPHEAGLAHFLKEGHFKGRMSLYFHTPIADAKSWGALPRDVQREFMTWLGEFHAIGFQTQGFRERFVRRCLDFGIRLKQRLYVSPVTINPQSVQAVAYHPDAVATYKAIDKWAGVDSKGNPRKVVLIVGRNDPTKSILPFLKVVKKYCEEHPELVDKTRVVVVTSETRENPVYIENKEEIFAEVDDINETYGSKKSGPMVVVITSTEKRKLTFAVTVGALRRADVSVTNSREEGFGIVCKEVLAVNLRWARIMLSDGCGAAGIFSQSAIVIPATVSIYPTDDEIDAGVAFLKEAVFMPEKKAKALFQTAQRTADEMEPSAWLQSQITAALSHCSGMFKLTTGSATGRQSEAPDLSLSGPVR